jgi:hypothetical protein
VSHLHIQQLEPVIAEFEAVQSAVSAALMDRSQENYRDLVRAEQNLESTYIIRLFSELEALLGTFLAAHDPVRRVPRELSNKIGHASSLVRMPNKFRDDLQQARALRNVVVHPEDGQLRAVVSFKSTISRVNAFLARLP